MSTTTDDEYFIRGIADSDKKAFSDLFDTYYVSLVMFCATYIHDLEQCRDIVSGLFCYLWEKGKDICVSTSLRAYLLNAVRNRALNEIRHRKIVDGHVRSSISQGILSSHDVDNYILYADMKERLENIVSGMPEKVQETYRCYIEEGMKSKDIAVVQNVTQRTVELRLNAAFAILKKSLICLSCLTLFNGIML